MLEFHGMSIDKLVERAKAKKLSGDALAEFVDAAKDLKAELAGAKVWVEYAVRNRDRVMDELKVEPIDVDKALKLLSLDARFKGTARRWRARRRRSRRRWMRSPRKRRAR